MSMPPASSRYFAEVAGEWDSLRSGYFSEAVRHLAIRKAYLRPEMVVADVGAGSGFMAAGLAPLVRQVHALDGSPEMLAVARENLKEFTNIIFQQAEGSQLLLPDGSLDAIFANMYLHHIPEPLGAIREMARLLNTGGRLVITDLDTHNHTWMQREMADVWLGFDRQQIRAWFEEAGLVNVIVDCSGEACCAESSSEQTEHDLRQASISVFVAVGTKRLSGARGAVQDHYASLALSGTSCCTPPQEVSVDCCADQELIRLDEIPQASASLEKGYSTLDRAAAPSEAAEFSLGCGNPIAMADLQPGETVLDIGSGGGLDVFLAARKVGSTGKAIGVDMTPEMLERARRSAQRAGLVNVEFRQGQAEGLPAEDDSIDVIISNCVINLVEDKGRTFREAYRVLKPGGRLEVSDIVTDGAFPADLRANPENWGSCVFGALPEGEYLDLLAQAGFTTPQTRKRIAAGSAAGVTLYSAAIRAIKPID
jgi:arsenite methyltransferase